MKKKILPLLFIIAALFPAATTDIAGFWVSPDDQGRPAAIIGIYEFQEKMYGRLIITYEEGAVRDTVYDRKERAEKVAGSPYFAGLDFIWDLERQGTRWVNGKILDPEEGKIYDASLWREGDELVVRGLIRIGFISLGRNQNWLPAGPEDLPPGFTLPDLENAVPLYHEPTD